MTNSNNDLAGYRYSDAELHESHLYLLPVLEKALDDLGLRGQPLFELGCGSGAIANRLSSIVFDVTGIDASTEGIQHAQRKYPHLKLAQASVYDDLASQYGTFPAVFSLEVIEHLYFPRKFVDTAFRLLQPGGKAIISTPYHGYWKNLVLAMTGKLDSHFTALWDHGHIKFWSEETLSTLLTERGFQVLSTTKVGRIPPLARSMVMVAQRP